MKNAFNKASRVVNNSCAHPLMTVAVFALVIGWALTGPRAHYSDTWQLVMNTTSSIVTFLMVFIIANAQKRDTEALLLKLDLLIAANPNATNKAVGLEGRSEEIAAAVRDEIAELAKDPGMGRP
ncbi:MAG: low affinity iron permease family protein [Candidatus Eremiobacteraeota bacterium]|nr:low affinity iron permease family protein [Candidatus Eremiobacteraeota bacterium]MBC5826745.1 low affinity iron permease family protein [Candidatus Eremiobacteraeota bacterium]